MEVGKTNEGIEKLALDRREGAIVSGVGIDLCGIIACGVSLSARRRITCGGDLVLLPILLFCVLCDRALRRSELSIFGFGLVCSLRYPETAVGV